MVRADFLNTITNVLCLSVKKREMLSYDGYEMAYTIIYWKYENICEWCTTKSKLTTSRGGASHGDLK